MLNGRRAGLLSLDHVRVLHDGDEVGILRVVELELAADARAGAPDPELLDRALSAIPGLTPEPASKLERALAMIGREPG
jgi:hypothetical protein